MLTILVVEDDTNTRKLMCAVLEQHGFTPRPAETAEAALDAMGRTRVDLIVLDLMMPGMNGYQFCETLRDMGHNLPILMVTAMQEPKDKRRGFRAGTDDYMTKPVDEEEMILRIQALLRRAKIAHERMLTVGDITLQYDALTVRWGDIRLELPQKEFYLLYKLLSNPGIIISRMQLMDEIWGMDSETDQHTVNVHINRLREKTRDFPGFELVTVRGLGYKAVIRS